jgi:hypothetical protein
MIGPGRTELGEVEADEAAGTAAASAVRLSAKTAVRRRRTDMAEIPSFG